VDHDATVDPGINFASIPQDQLLQHPADNLSHIPAQPDHGADPTHPHVEVEQSPSFKSADDSSANPGVVPSDAPTLTASSSDSSGTHGPAAPALAPGEDTSVQPTPADNGYQANADPEINFPSNAEHSADHSRHTPAQDDANSSAVIGGAHAAHRQGDESESANPKFADDGSAHPGKISHDLPALTSLPSDVSGDDSPHSFKPNLDHHASADPSLNAIAKDHPPQHSADNSLHTPAQHDDSGSAVVSDGAHTAPQVDGKQSDSFKFADDGSGHPGTGPDGAHPAHAQVNVDQLPSFKFADNDSAHPGTIPNDPAARTAPSSDSSGAHGPAAPALAKPSDIPGAEMSAAPDQFVFAKSAGPDPAADHKSDITDINHPVPADIRHLLHTAHDASAVGALDPNHTTAPQDMTKVQLPHHHGDFHFA
jgi:hypothetical protein